MKWIIPKKNFPFHFIFGKYFYNYMPSAIIIAKGMEFFSKKKEIKNRLLLFNARFKRFIIFKLKTL